MSTLLVVVGVAVLFWAWSRQDRQDAADAKR
jgi:hypothetical protein